MPPADTVQHLKDSVARTRDQIAAAAARSGRDADDVTLVAVTKTFPLETIHQAIAAGLVDLGENRVGELVEKSNAVPGEAMGGTVRWHAIGSLQRNKAREVAARADLFHALDSLRLADALDRASESAGRRLPVLVQVNISGEDSKGGFEPDEAHEMIAAIAERPNLYVVGVMGMAAPAAFAAELETLVRPAFRLLRRTLDTFIGEGREALRVVSMGMSGDFEVAIEEGATHVRIGSALFGFRPTVVTRSMP